MSATPRTAGPWEIRGVSVCDQDGDPIAHMALPIDEEGMPALMADARLIAAAPEMAEALEQTAAAMDALHPSAAGDMNDADYARLWNSTREALDAILFRIRGDAT